MEKRAKWRYEPVVSLDWYFKPLVVVIRYWCLLNIKCQYISNSPAIWRISISFTLWLEMYVNVHFIYISAIYGGRAGDKVCAAAQNNIHFEWGGMSNSIILNSRLQPRQRTYVKTQKKASSDKYSTFVMLLFPFILHIINEHLLPGAYLVLGEF